MPKKIIKDIVAPKKKKMLNNSLISPVLKKEEELTMAEISKGVVPTHPQGHNHFNLNDLDEAKKESMEEEENFSSIKNTRGQSALETLRMQNSSKKNNPTNHFGLWGLFSFGGVLIIVIVLLSTVFSGSKITITPKSTSVTVDNVLNTEKNITSESEVLPFELMSLSLEESKSIKSTGLEDVLEKATGRAIIYNNFDENPQKLLVKTRLESPDGKIYKIDSAVVVPGYTVKNGEKVPGSVEVTFHADIPGVDGNSGPTDFTIPGFKGTPRFDKFYARSVGDITGGLKGNVYKISVEDAEKTRSELENILKEKLKQKIMSQIPKGFVVYPDSVHYVMDKTSPNLFSKEEMVPVTLKGSAHAVIFDEKKLSKKIAEINISQFDGEDVFIPKIGELNFEFKDSDNTDITKAEKISFHLSGKADITWVVDEIKLKNDLLGKKKNELQAILKTYQNIDSADASVRPFWKSRFSDQMEKIKIVNKKSK